MNQKMKSILWLILGAVIAGITLGCIISVVWHYIDMDKIAFWKELLIAAGTGAFIALILLPFLRFYFSAKEKKQSK